MKIDRVEFNKLLNERVLFLDGAYGTVFMQQGFTDQPAIQLNLTAPEVVYKLHKEYLAAGADIILTNTFSGNRRKLKELGLEDKFFQLNKAAVELALDAAGDKLVFANLSSTGEFPQPLGSLSWYEVKDIFKEQAELLVAQGVDGFMIETMSDLKEIKAALLAVREVAANLPVIAQMTFAETFYSATGSYLKSFAALFSDLDVDVIGINCTLTPEEILPLLNELIKLTDKPVSVEANAGQPIFQDGQLSYPGSAREFMRASEKLVATGVNLLGGCCGTTPEYIEALVKQYQGSKFSRKKRNDVQYIASRSKIVGFDEFVSIGEQINPAGNKRLQDDIYNRNYNLLSQKAVLQKNAGAKALDINLGIENLLEKKHFSEVVNRLDQQNSLPLIFDIQTNEFLEQSLAEYPGRPILNSARVVKEDLDHKIKLMHKYGGMLILLAMDDQIPDTAAARVDLIKTGVNYLNENGIKTARILADPLMLSLGAGQNPEITLKTINQLNAAGIKTILGLSNLSFGMEARSALHAAFIAQAIREGLNAAILDPVDQNVMNNIKGSLLLLGKRVATGQKYQSNNEIVNALLAGDQSETNKIINYLLREYSPLKISQEKLGKAMELIGQLYEKQEIFLPQLLLAARTVEPIFTKLNNLLSKDDAYSSRGKVLLATVKNDIHDIGKNIIQAVLVGSGFQVKDIGKDQSTAQILAAVKSFKPDIVGLSAMMTGTIAQLEETVTQLKSEFPELKIMAGGASLTEELALAFGCDAYAANAISALKKCEILIN